MNRNQLVTGYLNAGYPLDYILGQEEVAWKNVRNGTRPDGSCSDMACDFYVHVDEQHIKRGKGQ